MRLYEQIKSIAQERDSAMDNYKMDIRHKLKLELESHIRNVGDIIAANLVESDGEDADAEAAPTADAPVPEATVAGLVSGASVESDSEISSSTCSGSEPPEGE